MTAIAQQINFLIDDLKPRRELLSARHAFVAIVVASVCLVLLSVGQAYTMNRLGTAIAAATAELSQLREVTEDLTQAASVQADATLVARIEALRADRLSRLALVDILSESSGVHTRGFSGYLEELARVREPGLWFTRLHFESVGARLELEGATLDPAHVPAFLASIAGGERFFGHKFDQFEIARNESGVLAFTITGPAVEQSK